jgi:phosphinothricin acetyltransferase
MLIRKLISPDWPLVKDIYLSGLATGNASFATNAPDWDSWDNGHLQHSRVVVELDGKVVGWAALSPVSGRCVYAGVAELSIYISEEVRGKGIGKTLLNEVIKSSETEGIWTLQSGIFKENEASIKLHQKCGFRIVGVRERIGQRDGIWRDVVLMERRSEVI